MDVAFVIGVTVVVVILALFEWPELNNGPKKEKWSFVTVTIVSWVLAILLIFFPDMQGPTQLIDAIFKPLGRFLEQ